MSVGAIIASMRRGFENCRHDIKPFPHWTVECLLPDDVARLLQTLPFDPPKIGETFGKRATHNDSRIFLSGETYRHFKVCREIAEAFQGQAISQSIEKLCKLDLSGSSLRIELCLDTDGFWLEPHTDIGAKLFTMQIYLSNDPGHERLGTDIYDRQQRFVEMTPARFNSALIFVPGSDTWHGFRKRRITGIRRSIIVNYVDASWRQRQELAFPDRPIV